MSKKNISIFTYLYMHLYNKIPFFYLTILASKCIKPMVDINKGYDTLLVCG